MVFSFGLNRFSAEKLLVEAVHIRLHAPVTGWVLATLELKWQQVGCQNSSSSLFPRVWGPPGKVVTETTIGGWTSCSCTLDPVHKLKTITFSSLYMYFYFIVNTFISVLNIKFCSTSHTRMLVSFWNFTKRMSFLKGCQSQVWFGE